MAIIALSASGAVIINVNLFIINFMVVLVMVDMEGILGINFPCGQGGPLLSLRAACFPPEPLLVSPWHMA